MKFTWKAISAFVLSVGVSAFLSGCQPEAAFDVSELSFAQLESDQLPPDEIPEGAEDAPKPGTPKKPEKKEPCSDHGQGKGKDKDKDKDAAIAFCGLFKTKVLICHVPEGNPEAKKTLCVDAQGARHGHGLEPALPEEVGGHGGDTYGACEGADEAE